MCGIVGYVGTKVMGNRLIEGLKRLEYRGYDSSGLAVVSKNKLEQIKRVGRVKALEAALSEEFLKAQAHMPYPLGNPRSSYRSQRPPSYQ